MLRLRRLPTTHAVFSHLTVLLFGYCILVLCISQTERRSDAVPTSWLVHTISLKPAVMWVFMGLRPLTSGRARAASL